MNPTGRSTDSGGVTVTVEQLAGLLGTTSPAGRGGVELRGFDTLESAGPDQLSYFADAKFADALAASKAGAVLVSRELISTANETVTNDGPALLEVDNAAVAADQILAAIAPPMSQPPAGVHPSAIIDESAKIGTNASVGPNVVVGPEVTIGDNVVLHPGVQIATRCTLGDDCELHANVVLRDYTELGSRVVVHAGSILGSDGFGYRWNGTEHVKVPQIGRVVIEDDVEIGSCTCVDRGKTRETRIGAGTKIDNLVQVGHNVQVGRHCILCANVGIAGSTTIGDGTIFAGASGVKDHVKIGAGVRVAGYSAVHTDVPDGVTMLGAPARPYKEYLRQHGAVSKLPDLMKQMKDLRKRVAELEAKQAD